MRSRLLSRLVFLLFCTPILVFPPSAVGQTTPPIGREAALNLEFGVLDFQPPEVELRRLASGISVLFMEDHSLPLVTLYARFKGGYSLLPREYYAAATALPGLMRSGGTRNLSPDSVDHLLDFYALQTAFGGGGESTFSNLNTLKRHLPSVIQLWGEILRNPRFEAGPPCPKPGPVSGTRSTVKMRGEVYQASGSRAVPPPPGRDLRPRYGPDSTRKGRPG